MKIGDLVKHKSIAKTRQVGIITATKWLHNQEKWKYCVLWACTQKEEYWFTTKELEVL